MDDDDRRLLDCSVIQRLRYIRQNDVAYLVYPSLNTSRFEHSLGVFHLAGRLAVSALDNTPEAADYLGQFQAALPGNPSDPAAVFVRAASWYGLLHDVGHLPFSHLTEQALTSELVDRYQNEDCNFAKPHEAAGCYLVRSDAGLRDAFKSQPAASWVVEQLLSHKEATPAVLQPLKEIVDSDLDADRLDSTARDGLLSGGDHGNYDEERVIRNAMLNFYRDRWHLIYSTRALSAVEALLVERTKTHRWIHYQAKVVAFKAAYSYCLERLDLDPGVWHASNYVGESSYLDDAWVLGQIGGMEARPTGLEHWARRALIHRSSSVVALWKRPEEFRQLSTRVADGDEELEAHNAIAPILNEFSKKAMAGQLEYELNESAGGFFRYLIYQTGLNPFSPSHFDRGIGLQRLFEPSTGKRLLLTRESKTVAALREIGQAEPSLGVSVVGEPEQLKEHRDVIREQFIAVAHKLLSDESHEASS